MQSFQAVIVVFLAFIIGVNCADFENSTAFEYGTESTVDDFYCADNPCRNGGTCINEGDTYTCVCPEYFVGKNCSESIVCETLGKELCGRGKCYFDMEKFDYNCTCDEGDVYTSLKGCLVDHCASNPCKNGGTCSMMDDGTYSCLCSDIYFGKDCSERKCFLHEMLACGEAFCYYNSVLRKATCFCPPNQKFDEHLKTCKVDHCASNPCKNGGTCSMRSDGTYRCSCSEIYTGKNCSERKGCLYQEMLVCGEATCKYNTFSRKATCSCPISEKFDKHLKICKGPCKPDPCVHGTCVKRFYGDFYCTCFSSYTGTYCNEKVKIIDPCKSNPCQNGGSCFVSGSKFKCSCKSLYSGNTCELDPCKSNPCQNGGSCSVSGSKFQCSCKSLYSGNTCELGNKVLIPSLLGSLGIVALLSLLCGLFWYKKKQNLKKMSKPVSSHVLQPATTLENGQTNIYPSVTR